MVPIGDLPSRGSVVEVIGAGTGTALLVHLVPGGGR